MFTGIFLVGRYAAYFAGVIQSGLQTSPCYTFIWTMLMGACIGVVWILLGNSGHVLSLRRRAARFGFLVLELLGCVPCFHALVVFRLFSRCVVSNRSRRSACYGWILFDWPKAFAGLTSLRQALAACRGYMLYLPHECRSYPRTNICTQAHPSGTLGTAGLNRLVHPLCHQLQQPLAAPGCGDGGHCPLGAGDRRGGATQRRVGGRASRG